MELGNALKGAQWSQSWGVSKENSRVFVHIEQSQESTFDVNSFLPCAHFGVYCLEYLESVKHSVFLSMTKI